MAKPVIHAMRPMLKNTVEHNVSGFSQSDLARFRHVEATEIYTWSLLIDGANEDPEKIDSEDLPTPWSWPLLFEQRLFNPSEIYHEQTFMCWAACLAGIALSDDLDLNLDLSNVQLSQSKSSHDHPFLNLLTLTLPHHSLNKALNWHLVFLFSQAEHLFCLSHPTSLVCPVASGWNELSLPWSTTSPQDFLTHLDIEPARLFFHWLNKAHSLLQDALKDEYTAPPGEHALSLSDLVLRLLDALAYLLQAKKCLPELTSKWQEYLQLETLQAQSLLKKIAPDYKKASFLQNKVQQVVQHLPRPLQIFEQAPYSASITEDNCPLKLKCSAGKQNKKDLFLLSNQYLKHPDYSPYQRVIGKLNLIQVLEKQKEVSDDTWFGDQFLDHSRWIWADTVWTDDLYFFPGESSLPAGREDIFGLYNLEINRESVIPLIPLRSWILKYLNADELIIGNLTFDVLGEEVQVTLNLPLVNDKTLTLSKSYLLSPDRILRHVPVFKIWPDHLYAEIKSYWTYYSAYGQSESTCLIRPFDLSEGTGSLSAVDKEIHQVESFPDVLHCTLSLQGERSEIGLIFLDTPKPLKCSQKQANIAIDLGTTNTNALLKLNGIIHPIIFDAKHLLSVTDSGFEHDLYEDFLGTEDVHLPFLSLFKLNHLNPLSPANFKPLIDGHIYYVDTINTFEADRFIKTDLKWDTEDKRLYLTGFIEQLCQQIVLEALRKGAEEITFHFSYPLAFSNFDLRAFQMSIKLALTRLQKRFYSGIQTEAKYHSEGVASAYYFSRGNVNLPPARFHKGVVILDIGGGTTDITIIEGKESTLRYTSSIKFAGRDIFMRIVLDHLPILHLLGIPDHLIESLSQRNKTSNEKSAPLIATLDALIHEYEEEMFQKLRYAYAVPQVESFLSHLAMGVGGIFYYLGHILNYLYQNKEYSQNKNLPTFYLAGNGAKIFRWFERPGAHKDNIYHQFFRDSFMHFGRLPFQVEGQVLGIYSQLGNQESKPEVVQGMLLEHSLLNIRGTRILPRFLSGEPYNLEGSSFSASSLLSRESLLQPDFSSNYSESQYYFEKYQRWLRKCFAHQALSEAHEQKYIENVQRLVKRQWHQLVTDCQANPEKQENLRDENILFIQSLKQYHFHYNEAKH